MRSTVSGMTTTTAITWSAQRAIQSGRRRGQRSKMPKAVSVTRPTIMYRPTTCHVATEATYVGLRSSPTTVATLRARAMRRQP